MKASQHLRIYKTALQQMGKDLILTPYLESVINAEGLSKKQLADDAFVLLSTSAGEFSADEIAALLILSNDLTASKEGIDILNHLLLLSNHYCHEDIAQDLQRARDPSSVRSLATAAEQEFDYLAWDDGKALARKCMWALGSIGTDEARAEIERFSRSNDPVIAGWAKEQWHRIAR